MDSTLGKLKQRIDELSGNVESGNSGSYPVELDRILARNVSSSEKLSMMISSRVNANLLLELFYGNSWSSFKTSTGLNPDSSSTPKSLFLSNLNVFQQGESTTPANKLNDHSSYVGLGETGRGLSDDIILEFCAYLYKNGLFDELARILLDRFSLDDLVEKCGKLIHMLDGFDSKELLIIRFGTSFLKLDQPQIASQICQQFDETFEGFFAISQKMERLENDYSQNIDLFFQTEYQSRFSQGLWDRTIPLSIRAQAAYMSVRDGQLSVDQLFKRHKGHPAFVEQQNALRHFLILSKCETESLMFLPSICKNLRYFTHHISGEDLCALFEVSSKRTLKMAWNSYKQYLRNSTEHFSDPSHDQSAVLNYAIAQATKLRESITCAHIFKFACSRTNANILTKVKGKAISMILVSLTPKHERATKIYLSRPKDDLLISTLCVCPDINNTLRVALNRHQSNPSGALLWTLLLAIEEAHVKLDNATLHVISKMVSCRPLPEQLRFMALAVTSEQGIIYLLKESTSASSNHSATSKLTHDETVLLISSALIVATEKSNACYGRNEETLTNTINTIFASGDVKLFTSVQDIGKLVAKFRCKSYDAVLNPLVQHLCALQNFRLVLSLMKYVADIPESAYRTMLISLAYYQPIVARRLYERLKANHIKFEASLYPDLLSAYAKSPELTPNQVTRMAKVLLGKKQRIGAPAAKALVDGLLAKYLKTNKGSKEQLKWALAVAQSENVSAETVRHWNQLIDQMRISRQGLWSR